MIWVLGHSELTAKFLIEISLLFQGELQFRKIEIVKRNNVFPLKLGKHIARDGSGDAEIDFRNLRSIISLYSQKDHEGARSDSRSKT